MLYIFYSLDILLLLAIPIVLGIFLVRRLELEGRWWWIGAAVYILSQIILKPLENYAINPILNNMSYSGRLPSIDVLLIGSLVLGLGAALVQEILRYGMFRWWAKDARSFESGVLLGAGHGGAESIIVALLVFYNFVNMAMVRNMDLSTLVQESQVPFLQAQITAFWSAPWYFTLREAIGQLFMLVIQISLAIVVLQVFLRKNWLWIIYAIGFHTIVEATRVMAQNLVDEMSANLLMGIFAIISALIIFKLRSIKNENLSEPLGSGSSSDKSA